MSEKDGRPTDERVKGWLHSAFQEIPDRNLSIAAGRWSQVLSELLALRSQVARLEKIEAAARNVVRGFENYPSGEPIIGTLATPLLKLQAALSGKE